MNDDEFWEDQPRSMEVNTAGFVQPAGFVWMKETAVDRMNPQEIERLRKAANIASVLPDLSPEIEKMQESTMSQVFGKLSKGELTPEEALSYWYEMYSYHRLSNRLRVVASTAEQVTDRRQQS